MSLPVWPAAAPAQPRLQLSRQLRAALENMQINRRRRFLLGTAARCCFLSPRHRLCIACFLLFFFSFGSIGFVVTDQVSFTTQVHKLFKEVDFFWHTIKSKTTSSSDKRTLPHFSVTEELRCKDSSSSSCVISLESAGDRQAVTPSPANRRQL